MPITTGQTSTAASTASVGRSDRPRVIWAVSSTKPPQMIATPKSVYNLFSSSGNVSTGMTRAH